MYKYFLVIFLGLAGCLPDYECHTVKEVLGCSARGCRVVLDSGQRASIFSMVFVEDRVRIFPDTMSGRIREGFCPQDIER